MLNQVFVFGYFHADLHPANLFILPGDAIGYVDFGIVGQLPDRVRDSLTQYSWLLFRGEVEGAVHELMRWLAPGTATDQANASRQLVRVHQAFLYDTVAGRSRVTEGAPGPSRNPSDNPYSKLAVDILQTIRVNELTMSASIVSYLKMLVTLGSLRHQLAVEYDLSENVRHFGRRLARQQSLALLDPRRTVDRLFAGVGQVQRALEFVEFAESLEPVILEATTPVRVPTADAVGQRGLIRIGSRSWRSAPLLYLVLVFPDDTRHLLPPAWTTAGSSSACSPCCSFSSPGSFSYIRGLGRED